MEYAELKEWLDKQVAWRNEGIALKNFNSRIDALDVHFDEYREIHIYDADVVSDILGIDLQREHFNEEYDQLYFMYEGYKVFCLRNKEDGS